MPSSRPLIRKPESAENAVRMTATNTHCACRFGFVASLPPRRIQPAAATSAKSKAIVNKLQRLCVVSCGAGPGIQRFASIFFPPPASARSSLYRRHLLGALVTSLFLLLIIREDARLVAAVEGSER